MFIERLKEYREKLKMTKREMAEALGIGESYYNMLESGKRSPSKTVIVKLINHSHQPEEYWIYGITNDYLSNRDRIKHISEAFYFIDKMSSFKTDNEIKMLFSTIDIKKLSSIEQMLLIAIKADLEDMLNKK